MKKIATKNKVMDYLQWSTEEYDNRMFKSYWNWCSLNSQYPSVTQQLVASTRVNRWFMFNMEKFELQFLKMIEASPVTNIQLLREHYYTATSEIMLYKPSAMLSTIKRNKNFSDQYNFNHLQPVIYAN